MKTDHHRTAAGSDIIEKRKQRAEDACADLLDEALTRAKKRQKGDRNRKNETERRTKRAQNTRKKQTNVYKRRESNVKILTNVEKCKENYRFRGEEGETRPPEAAETGKQTVRPPERRAFAPEDARNEQKRRKRPKRLL